jgi:hypothetical protein
VASREEDNEVVESDPQLGDLQEYDAMRQPGNEATTGSETQLS